MYEKFDADELMALAKIDIENKNLEGALHKLKVVLENKKAPQEVLPIIARVYAQLGLFEKAKTHYEKYLGKNPDSELERFQLGMIHFDLDQIEDAVKEWNAVLEKNSGFIPALYYKSLVYLRQEKIDEAKASINELLRISAPDNMYYNKARDLLTAIDRRIGDRSPEMSPKTSEADSSKISKKLPKDAYKNKH